MWIYRKVFEMERFIVFHGYFIYFIIISMPEYIYTRRHFPRKIRKRRYCCQRFYIGIFTCERSLAHTQREWLNGIERALQKNEKTLLFYITKCNKMYGKWEVKESAYGRTHNKHTHNTMMHCNVSMSIGNSMYIFVPKAYFGLALSTHSSIFSF